MIITHSKSSTGTKTVRTKFQIAIEWKIPIVLLLLDTTPIPKELESYDRVHFEDFGGCEGINLLSHYKIAFRHLTNTLDLLRL